MKPFLIFDKYSKIRGLAGPQSADHLLDTLGRPPPAEELRYRVFRRFYDMPSRAENRATLSKDTENMLGMEG